MVTSGKSEGMHLLPEALRSEGRVAVYALSLQDLVTDDDQSCRARLSHFPSPLVKVSVSHTIQPEHRATRCVPAKDMIARVSPCNDFFLFLLSFSPGSTSGKS